MRYILKIFGDIPRIFLDYFEIILYFLYVCQSVSLLYLFQLVISGGQLLRPLVLFNYASWMYLWQKSLDCISLKYFSACLVFMPTIGTANKKPPVIDIHPLKYYISSSFKYKDYPLLELLKGSKGRKLAE